MTAYAYSCNANNLLRLRTGSVLLPLCSLFGSSLVGVFAGYKDTFLVGEGYCSGGVIP